MQGSSGRVRELAVGGRATLAAGLAGAECYVAGSQAHGEAGRT